MSVINTNVKSIMAQNALVTNNRSLEKAMQQLSTGRRINGAADDAAGLAISETMTAQIRGLNQAVRNANDAASMLQLAVQAANGTISSDQRGFLEDEYAALKTAITSVATDTKWNGQSVLNTTATVTYQVGADSSNTMAFTFAVMTAGALTLSATIGLQATATTAIGQLDTAINAVSDQRALLGATINRLSYASDNLANVAMNTEASRSRIRDTDYAQATTELARTQIIQQAATAMLAQANQQPQSVLALLK
jgi:flagellin